MFSMGRVIVTRLLRRLACRCASFFAASASMCAVELQPQDFRSRQPQSSQTQSAGDQPMPKPGAS
jgi:hypothetical protein